MPQTVAVDLTELEALRKDLHQHPELGFEEWRTSEIVTKRLSTLGYAVHNGLAKTGVVGVLENGPGPVIGIRADMDALPMSEKTNLSWSSRRAGLFHGCGHDGHTAILLGLAEHLARRRQFSGTVILIFQPAEEGLGGGRVMVEEGLFTRFACEKVFGFHNMPLLPLGQASIKAGPSMASQDDFRIAFTGTSAHAAMPHFSRDVALALAEATVSLQALISRETDPHVPAALSVTQIHTGTANNVIPDEGFLSGTVRTLERATRTNLEAALRRVAAGIAATRGVDVAVDYHHGFPVLVNDADAAAAMRAAVVKTLGATGLNDAFKPLLAAEDFAYMLEARPGAYVLLGQRDEEHAQMVHNSAYDFNDKLLPIAIRTLAALVET